MWNERRHAKRSRGAPRLRPPAERAGVAASGWSGKRHAKRSRGAPRLRPPAERAGLAASGWSGKRHAKRSRGAPRLRPPAERAGLAAPVTMTPAPDRLLAMYAGMLRVRLFEERVRELFGGGAANRGPFHEGVNLAALWKLPVIFVCENNRWASTSAHALSTAGGSIAARAAGYGIPGESIDGNDVLAVWDAVTQAAARGRRGDGPSLVEAHTIRWVGHFEGDPQAYRSQDEVAAGRRTDPVARLERVLNAPISEAAIVGSAMGAAMTGLVPVVDMHFADFVTCAMDEVANQIAKSRYMFGGQIDCPITLRMPYGIGRSGGGHHSNSVEAWFVNIPGLNLCIPSTPADAYGLLTTAIRDPDPVLVFEHRGLYRVTGEVGDAETLVPLGSADVKRPGRDVTVIATARMVHESLAAARPLPEAGIAVTA